MDKTNKRSIIEEFIPLSYSSDWLKISCINLVWC